MKGFSGLAGNNKGLCGILWDQVKGGGVGLSVRCLLEGFAFEVQRQLVGTNGVQLFAAPTKTPLVLFASSWRGLQDLCVLGVVVQGRGLQRCTCALRHVLL
jgi:hypothetical protein